MLLLMDKSGLAKHKLTVEKGINMYPLYQQNQPLFALSPGDCGSDFVSLKEEACFLSSRWKQKKTKHATLFK